MLTRSVLWIDCAQFVRCCEQGATNDHDFRSTRSDVDNKNESFDRNSYLAFCSECVPRYPKSDRTRLQGERGTRECGKDKTNCRVEAGLGRYREAARNQGSETS